MHLPSLFHPDHGGGRGADGPSPFHELIDPGGPFLSLYRVPALVSLSFYRRAMGGEVLAGKSKG